jgi:hypothetical protein
VDQVVVEQIVVDQFVGTQVDFVNRRPPRVVMSSRLSWGGSQRVLNIE